MKIVDGQYGLPSLSKVDFTLIWSAGGKTPAAVEFGRMIEQMTRGSQVAAALNRRA